MLNIKMNGILYENTIRCIACVMDAGRGVGLWIRNTQKPASLSADAYPCVQFGWHGWHSRSWSAYLKMKLLAPCKPSGHFSTQFGPSLKWEHFVQLSGPWNVKNKINLKKKNRPHLPWNVFGWLSYRDLRGWSIHLYEIGKHFQ